MNKSSKLFVLLLTAILFTRLVNAEYASTDILGKWHSINEESKEVTGLWELRLENNKLRGYLLDYPDAKPSDKCDKCSGDSEAFFDAPVLGTAWLQLNEFSKGRWQEGFIIDSRNGKKYTAKVWLEDEQLKMRGYIGWFYRTQIWQRPSPD